MNTTERTMVGTYHLHTDEMSGPEEFNVWCAEAGLQSTDFSGHPEGFEHFEPNRHRTRKFEVKEEFERAFAETSAAAERMGIRGYIEGEFVSRVIDIHERDFVDFPFPFTIHRRRLNQNEVFREGEIHLTFDYDASDERRVLQLLQAGLFGALEEKADGNRYLVLTAQGYMRDIVPLAERLEQFLGHAGGLVRVRLKIERAIGWKLFGMTSSELPPIIDRIVWG